MTDQTDEHGRRLESLFDAGRKLPTGEKAQFIQREAGRDSVLAGQLADLLWVSLPTDTGLSTAGADPFDLKLGTEFGGCQIVLDVGAGGMGAVYLARDLANEGRLVALKVMKPTLPDETDRQRFAKETAALSRLVHPNIAQFYFKGIQEFNGAARPYFVMEYVEGLTLDRYLEKHKPTRRQLLTLLRKICLAVHHGHLKGVYHRDLKPSNILITAEGEPKIIDFGIAMVAMDLDGNKQNQPNERTGTVMYMAPETARGEKGFLDARTEVYSLGIIAFELFARRLPAVVLPSGALLNLDRKLTSGQILEKIASCERQTLDAVDRDLQRVIAKSLCLQMDQRYTDASVLAEDLRRLISLEPISARSTSGIYTARMFVLRNRLAVFATAAVFLAVLASAIFFAVSRSRVKALLVQKSADLRVIQQKNAEAHFHSASLAEQRGNWSVAFDEFRQAEDGHYPDRLSLAVGELRSVGRLDHRSADTDALISRVHTDMPDIAESPRFQVVEGFSHWSSRPAQSLQSLQRALAHTDQLDPADRAFAEALTTDDIKLAAAKLQAVVDADPFNHDAWVLLGFCDLALGDTQKCEQDAGVLQRLYPDDQVAAVLGSIAAAFQGRRTSARAYLTRCINLPPEVSAAIVDVVDGVSQFHCVDDWEVMNFWTKARFLSKLAVLAPALKASHELPTPITFRRFTDLLSRLTPINMAKNPRPILEAIAELPSGDGEFAAGQLAFLNGDFAAALKHFQTVMVSPCLIDCRRRTAFFIACEDQLDRSFRHVPIDAEGTALIEKDLDRLISLGGVRPEIFDEEHTAVAIGVLYRLHPQVRTLAFLWLSRAPDDARAMYYLAIADSNLGERDLAIQLFTKALEKGLPDGMKKDGQVKLKSLMDMPATRSVGWQ